MGKIFKDISAFERGMVVAARRTNLSVSRTATLQLFSRSTVSRVYQAVEVPQRKKGRTSLFSEFHKNTNSETFKKVIFF
jgi:hypothetical protein